MGGNEHHGDVRNDGERSGIALGLDEEGKTSQIKETI
jgi:hypothetical protein